jgi:hypothetical protein
MSFTQKLINYTISGGVIGGSSISLNGLRSTCRIVNGGAPSMGVADIAIFGMTLSQMNQLTTLGTNQINLVNQTGIQIQAGDSNGLSLIFEGTISFACVDALAMPEVCFRITAHAGLFQAVMPSKPTSFQGSVDVAQIAQELAQKMGLKFENHGVNIRISNPYLSGSYRTQMQTLAEHAGIQWTIDRGVLAIWPTGKSRQSSETLISADTGMVATPAFNRAGVIVTCLFNPSLQMGFTFQIKSIITPANGQWTIYKVDYDLESITPHGRWFSIVYGFNASFNQEPSGDQG